jgi:ATP-dependent DNA ligase
VDLPVQPPILPMLAKRMEKLPSGDGWIFEPKWDGFRALIFRDGDEVLIQSREQKSLNRYFPELIAPLKSQLPRAVCWMARLSLQMKPASTSNSFSFAFTPPLQG